MLFVLKDRPANVLQCFGSVNPLWAGTGGVLDEHTLRMVLSLAKLGRERHDALDTVRATLDISSPAFIGKADRSKTTR